MSRRTVVLLIASHAAALAAGLVAGAWLGVGQIHRANAIAQDMGEIDRLGAYVSAQRWLGDVAAYEAALLDYVSKLEARRLRHSPVRDDGAIATEIALTQTRLALLAEKRGDSVTAEKYLAAAMAQCSAAFIKNCSADRLRQTVLALDSKFPNTRPNEK